LAEERVRPDVLVAALLDEIAGRLHDIEKMVRESRPEGAVHPISATVTGPEVLDFTGGPPYRPLFAVTIYNDGPDGVYPSVNEYRKTAPLKPGESVKFEYVLPRIARLYLDVEREGRKAVIRGFGAY
jgi:hypothetical protein